MFRRSLLALMLAMSIAAPAAATTTEADAIRAVYDAWGQDGDHGKALAGLDALYTETASEACKGFASLLFTGIALIDAWERLSPDNHLGAQIGLPLLLQHFERAEYACRIAL